MIFALEMDCEKWEIAPIRTWNEDEFSKLIHINLLERDRKKVAKTGSLSTESYQNSNPKVTEIGTNGEESYRNSNREVTETVSSGYQNRNFEVTDSVTSYQNSNSKVTETVTPKLPKQELRQSENPYATRVEGVSKDSIKDNVKDNKELVVVVKDKPNVFVFWEKNGFGTISSFLSEEIGYWLDGQFFDESEEVIVEAMKIAILNNVRTWNYVNGILENWKRDGLKTIDQIKAHIAAFKTTGGNRSNAKDFGRSGGNQNPNRAIASGSPRQRTAADEIRALRERKKG
nr:DnaD domain protein [Ammoniphilus oxalaticus]